MDTLVHDAHNMCNVPGLNITKRKKRMWSDFETHVRPPPTPYFPTTHPHKISHSLLDPDPLHFIRNGKCPFKG